MQKQLNGTNEPCDTHSISDPAFANRDCSQGPSVDHRLRITVLELQMSCFVIPIGISIPVGMTKSNEGGRFVEYRFFLIVVIVRNAVMGLCTRLFCNFVPL